jgi:uracil-DNA glycosylase
MVAILPALFNQLSPVWRKELHSCEAAIDSIEKELGTSTYIPESHEIFAALRVNPSDISVVILGQDPYPNPLDAMGLAFSVRQGRPLPASLRNISKELQTDVGFPLAHGDLSHWVNQGVLLLNPILTTEPGKSLAHRHLGWEAITQSILEVAAINRPVAILWGKKAHSYASLFEPDLTIQSAHPSPLSAYRGFFGSRPFSRANTMLETIRRPVIDWQVDPSL